MESWIFQLVIPKAGFSGLEGGTGKSSDFPSHFLSSVQRLMPENHFDSIFPRICPGKHFALRPPFLDILCTLTAFDIEPPAGQTIEVKYHEVAIRCVIIPIFTLLVLRRGLIRGIF